MRQVVRSVLLMPLFIFMVFVEFALDPLEAERAAGAPTAFWFDLEADGAADATDADDATDNLPIGHRTPSRARRTPVRQVFPDRVTPRRTRLLLPSTADLSAARTGGAYPSPLTWSVSLRI